MKSQIALLALAGGLVLTAPAYAQDAPEPAQDAPASPGTTFTPDEVQKFAKAAVELNEIQADTSIAEADKQQRMVAVVQNQGLDPQKFNEIAQASQTDADLQKQIQEAVASQQPQQ